MSLTLVPLALVAVLAIWLAHEDERRDMEQALLDRARPLTVAVDREVETSIAGLKGLATSDDLAARDDRHPEVGGGPRRCSIGASGWQRRARRGRLSPEVAAMTTARPAGSRPPGWQQEHARRYMESGGKDGHLWEGVTTLLLTTTGRRSGQPRTTPLIYGKDGDRYVVVASRGGAPAHPAWYENLAAKPDIQVQVMADRFKARARTASAAERPALWKKMAAIWPPYDEYQAKTAREIPVVIIERA